MTGRANYGLDAPTVVRNNAVIGAAAIAAGAAAYFLLRRGHPDLAASVFIDAGIAGLILLGLAAFMVWSSLVGKFGVRDRLLGKIAWRGDEHVLDIGCGRGLALIGAAKRLSSGSATGVDLWSQVDLSANSAEATLANAAAEGVHSKVALQTGDARQLPFADEAFDVVLSMTALHNIPDKTGRAQALSEAVRVLKPSGRLVIFDIFKTREYRAWLQAHGLVEITASAPILLWLAPGRILTAKKAQS